MRKFLPRRTVAAASVAGALGVAVAFTSAGTAQAAGIDAKPGEITVCATPTDTITVAFPDRNNYQITPRVIPHEQNCISAKMGGNENEQINIYSDQGQFIGSSIYNGSNGTVVVETTRTGYYVY